MEANFDSALQGSVILNIGIANISSVVLAIASPNWGQLPSEMSSGITVITDINKVWHVKIYFQKLHDRVMIFNNNKK